jgi:hypothetical protein
MVAVVERMSGFPPAIWELDEFESFDLWVAALRELPSSSASKAICSTLLILDAKLSLFGPAQESDLENEEEKEEEKGEEEGEPTPSPKVIKVQHRTSEDAAAAAKAELSITERAIANFDVVEQSVKVSDACFRWDAYADLCWFVVRELRKAKLWVLPKG